MINIIKLLLTHKSYKCFSVSKARLFRSFNELQFTLLCTYSFTFVYSIDTLPHIKCGKKFVAFFPLDGIKKRHELFPNSYIYLKLELALILRAFINCMLRDYNSYHA